MSSWYFMSQELLHTWVTLLQCSSEQCLLSSSKHLQHKQTLHTPSAKAPMSKMWQAGKGEPHHPVLLFHPELGHLGRGERREGLSPARGCYSVAEVIFGTPVLSWKRSAQGHTTGCWHVWEQQFPKIPPKWSIRSRVALALDLSICMHLERFFRLLTGRQD